VGVVAALVVVAVLWSGVLGTGRGSPGLSVPFSDARSLAETAADGFLPGSPVVVAALGLDERTGTTAHLTNLTGLLGANCTFTPLPGRGSTTNVTVPAYSGAFSAGLAPFWAVLLSESSGGAATLVLVVNATALPVATVSGAGCLAGGLGSQPLPADTADSPTAAAAAWSFAGQDWSSAAGSSVQGVAMIAIGGGSFEGTTYEASWLTAYLPCDPLAGGTVSTPADVVVALLSSGFPVLSATHDVACPV
jgi:hypothetical protein